MTLDLSFQRRARIFVFFVYIKIYSCTLIGVTQRGTVFASACINIHQPSEFVSRSFLYKQSSFRKKKQASTHLDLPTHLVNCLKYFRFGNILLLLLYFVHEAGTPFPRRSEFWGSLCFHFSFLFWFLSSFFC